jgi:quinohemoprotein ethanol dehydrogenase
MSNLYLKRVVALTLRCIWLAAHNLDIQAVHAWAGGQKSKTKVAAKPAKGNNSETRILNAEKGTGEDGNWLAHGRTFNEQRFSPLKLINDKNVKDLKLAWSYKLDVDRGTEATPIVVDGTMYTTGAYSIVYALDAKSGKLLWKYDPKIQRDYAERACCDAVNRGVAVLEGKVYVATLDGYLVALDAATGKVVWKKDTVIDRTRKYTITGAPRIARGKLFIGNGGAEFGVRGYVTAYEAKTGNQAWRFFTVPGDPGKPYESKIMETAAKTWTGNKYWGYGGGGTVWDSMAYDPDLNLLYIGVGNGAPWNQNYRSPQGGDNLFLSSIVALNADTGDYVWHYQTTPGDKWDYTATQHIILTDLSIGGTTRQVLMQAPKNGFFYVLDRKTGELISAEPYVKVTWAKGIDKTTGRPILSDSADYMKQPQMTFPSPYGGHNWQPMSYSPQTGLVYIPAQEVPFLYVNDQNFKERKRGFNNALGLINQGIPEDGFSVSAILQMTSGKLSAWDPVNQKEVWKVDFDNPWNGGVLSTAGNLVFTGTADGRVVAYSADKGESLWQAAAQTGVIAPPMTYMVDGEQYLAISVGWGGALGLVGGDVAKAARTTSIARVLTFKVGGTAELPPASLIAEAMPEIPEATASAETVQQGRELYHTYCVFCHGLAAVGGGAIKDLRYMSKDRHQSFVGIVQNGLAAKGMPDYKDEITAEQIKLIQAYIIKRAHDEKNRKTPNQGK